MDNLLTTRERELLELKLAYYFKRITSKEYMRILQIMQKGWDTVPSAELDHIARIMKRVKIKNNLMTSSI